MKFFILQLIGILGLGLASNQRDDQELTRIHQMQALRNGIADQSEVIRVIGRRTRRTFPSLLVSGGARPPIAQGSALNMIRTNRQTSPFQTVESSFHSPITVVVNRGRR